VLGLGLKFNPNPSVIYTISKIAEKSDTKISLEKSEKEIHKVGGFSLIIAGFVLFLFFIALMILQTSPTLTAEMMLDDPVPSVSLYALAAFGELILMPGVLGLYFAFTHAFEPAKCFKSKKWLNTKTKDIKRKLIL
jgi:hypothetical protein